MASTIEKSVNIQKAINAAVQGEAKTGRPGTLARALPADLPAKIKIGHLTATKLAQTSDVVRYEVFIKGKPTFIDVMTKLNPGTTLPAPEGFLKGRQGVVLADRDGVLNKANAFLNKGADVKADTMIPEALAGAKALDAAGVGLVVVTNQGGYQIGKMPFDEMLAVNVRVAQQLADAGGHVDGIIICPFNEALKSPGANDVDARKPSPGMPLHAAQMAKDAGVPVLGMAGDQRTDGAAAQGAGLPFFALTDPTFGRWDAELASAAKKGETLPTLSQDGLVEVGSLAEVASAVVSERAQATKSTTGFDPAPAGNTAAPKASEALATGIAQTLRSTEQAKDLPPAWLDKAAKAMAALNTEEPQSYEYRLVLDSKSAGNVAKALDAATGKDSKFSAGAELLMVSVHSYDEWSADFAALDVASGKSRPLGSLELDDFDTALGWDGNNTPTQLERAVLVPMQSGEFTTGNDLAGFENIARSGPDES